MADIEKCRQLLSVLKETIVDVGAVLKQCDELGAEQRELKEREAIYSAYLKELSVQYFKTHMEKPKEEASLAVTGAQATELEVERLQKLVRVYEKEREEYDVERQLKLAGMFMEMEENDDVTRRSGA